MRLDYGTYQHIANALSFSVDKQGVMSPRGQVYKYRIRYVINGRVEGTTQSEISDAIAALEAAYATPNQDLIFRDDAGNATAHQIIASNTISGVVVPRLMWRQGIGQGSGSGSQFVNRRDFVIVVEAEEEAPTAPFGGIVQWREALTAIGDGGTEFSVVESLTGTPIRQDTTSFTRGLLIQRGSAVGFDAPPLPPTPIFPSQNHSRLSEFSQTTPTQYANSDRMFGISWKYVMEDTGAMAGTPTLSVS